MSGLLFVFGTRPEAIKLAPLILRARREMEVRVCSTGQHRELLDDALQVFGIAPEYDLSVMQPGQSLTAGAARMLAGLDAVIAETKPDALVVQGDTTSTFCGALAGFYAGVPVAHVEAGLRTGDLGRPFPEEAHRVMAGRIARWHFAATRAAAANLWREGVERGRVFVTGNTGVDALLEVRKRLFANAGPPNGGKRLIVVTAHRRESAGEGRKAIAAAVRRLAGRGDVEVVCVLHPNPEAGAAMRRELDGTPGVTLAPAANYVRFVELMSRAFLLLSDSGGVQEEAPSLGKPVLVLRETTERQEAVEAGTAVLTGLCMERIVNEAERLLDDPAEYARRTAIANPYGDGRASERIVDALAAELGVRRMGAAV
ncbi:MAG: UDP-N-acetylglucosamine 2-epimerase (non-hydrolyzing) [Bryobacterales bacterium]|nr:UDP-N-acetylglucosamine 2-epimerase (non-hydrolyzing) [Bryobacterales bacterium]